MDNIDISFNPLKDWNSNPEWKSMDATVKGFFSQLLLIAAFNKPAGYLPDDDKLWRKWLNIPQKTFDDDDYNNYDIDQKDVAKTIKKYFDVNKNTGISSAMLEALESIWEQESSHKQIKNARISYDSWMNYLWIYKWKPELEKALIRIDVKLRIQFDELNAYEGFFFPLAYSMSYIQNPSVIPTGTNKTLETKPVKSRKKKKNNILPLPDILEVEAFDFSDIGYDGILWANTDNSAFSDLAKVLRLWRTPITSNRRKSIWEIGVSCLEDSPSNYPKARRFLGKMIKEFSEDKVARTVAEISRRPTMALEPYALFRTIITSYEHGSIGEQKARAQRSHVAL